MIKLQIFIYLCLLFVLLNAQRESLRERLMNKKFRVINYTTREMTNLRNRLNRGYHTLTFSADSLNMSGICNSCSFEINRFSGNTVDFGSGMCTLMYCEGAMPLEENLSKLIADANRISLRGRYLIISAGNRAIRAVMI